MDGLENGDTDFYMKRLPKIPVDFEYKDLLSDIVITSEWSEDLNSDFINLKPFDVMELNDYYNSNWIKPIIENKEIKKPGRPVKPKIVDIPTVE